VCVCVMCVCVLCGWCVCVCTPQVFRWGVVSPSPNSQAGGPHLVAFTRLLIQYIRSYPPYLVAVPLSATWGRSMPWWHGALLLVQFEAKQFFLVTLTHDICTNRQVNRNNSDPLQMASFGLEISGFITEVYRRLARFLLQPVDFKC